MSILMSLEDAVCQSLVEMLKFKLLGVIQQIITVFHEFLLSAMVFS